MDIRIIPTVLANTKEEFEERLAKLLPASNELQIDMMDGQFVPSTGIAVDDLPDLKQWDDHLFEVHIMVYHPERYIEPLAQRGCRRVIFHYEAIEDKRIPELVQSIRGLGMQSIIALNPETPVERILPFTGLVTGVLFLGVHPGFNGAPYVSSTPERIEELVRLTNGAPRSFYIQVDGGMTPETVGDVVRAGATRINSGSFVSKADDPTAAIQQLMEIAQAATPKMEKVKAAKRSAVPRPRKTRRPQTQQSHTKASQHAQASKERRGG